MNSVSPHSGLFSSDGVDPRIYHGPPNLRRARTPGLNANPSQTASHQARSHSAMSVSQTVVSLYDFDDAQGQPPNTPRSLKACTRIGIIPSDLLRPTLNQTLEEMRKAREDTSDRDVVKMRHTFKAQMQKRKLKAAVESYWSVCEEEALTPTKKEKATVDSTKVLNEEKQLRKIVETNKSRLRQQILRMQLLQKQRQREDESLEAQRMAALQKKQDTVKAMAERSKMEEEAAALRMQAREIEKAQIAAAADDARRRYEAQDDELRLRMDERRRELDRRNAQKREENRLRRSRMKAQSDAVMEQRREELESRMETFENEHQARMRQKEIEQARKRSEAEARAEKIQDAIARSNAQLQAKILMTEAKGAAVERRLKDFASDRATKRLATLEDELEKEAKRQETYESAMNVQNERMKNFISRMELNEEKQNQLQATRRKNRVLNHELAKQRMLTKQDAVEHQKRIDEEHKNKLIAKVNEKLTRIADMKASNQEMKVQRMLHREEAERTRVKITEVTPGPSDYVITEGDCGTNHPQWKMGLPASAAGPRVVLKNHPVPGYDQSPGPAAYNVGGVDNSRHRNRSAYSFTQAERFDYSQDIPSV